MTEPPLIRTEITLLHDLEQLVAERAKSETRIEAALERHHRDLWTAHRVGLLAAESALWHSPDLPISGCAVCRHGPRLQDVLDVPLPPRR